MHGRKSSACSMIGQAWDNRTNPVTTGKDKIEDPSSWEIESDSRTKKYCSEGRKLSNRLLLLSCTANSPVQSKVGRHRRADKASEKHPCRKKGDASRPASSNTRRTRTTRKGDETNGRCSVGGGGRDSEAGPSKHASASQGREAMCRLYCALPDTAKARESQVERSPWRFRNHGVGGGQRRQEREHRS